MIDITPPARTAGELTLPNGTRVWLQTLNTLQKEDADKRTRRFAQNECRALLKGGEDHAAMTAEIFAMSAELQAEFVASGSYWPIQDEAATLHPYPEEPQQGELGAQEFTEAYVAWEAELLKAREARRQYEETRYEEIRQMALRLSNRNRRDRCAIVYFEREFVTAYTRRLKFETLWRAARSAEDNLQRYFPSVEALEDADDALQSALWEFYSQMDVSPNLIPTSPAQS